MATTVAALTVLGVVVWAVASLLGIQALRRIPHLPKSGGEGARVRWP